MAKPSRSWADGASDVFKTTAATGATVAVNDGTLQLAKLAQRVGGRLNANLSLGTNGTLTNNAGTFTVQRVAAQQAGQGTVRAADGNLNVINDIGSKEQPVATVATTGGNISAGGIYTARIAAEQRNSKRYPYRPRCGHHKSDSWCCHYNR